MRVELLFASNYIRAVDFLGKDVTLTIASVTLENLETNDGAKKRKGIVGFKETPKGWVLNRTNALCLAAMFGKDTDQWRGKRVTLCHIPHKDKLTGEDGFAIRVRGSPDLTSDIRFNLSLPRKKPQPMTLRATGKGQQQKQDNQPATEPEEAAK